jgi:hypothetical protein
MSGSPGSGNIGNSIVRSDRQLALTWLLAQDLRTPALATPTRECAPLRPSCEQKCCASTVGRSDRAGSRDRGRNAVNFGEKGGVDCGDSGDITYPCAPCRNSSMNHRLVRQAGAAMSVAFGRHYLLSSVLSDLHVRKGGHEPRCGDTRGELKCNSTVLASRTLRTSIPPPAVSS